MTLAARRLVGWEGQWWRQVGGTTLAPTLVPSRVGPPPGSILAVSVKGVSHEGLWTGADVVHKSARRGAVARESLARFAGSKLVRVCGTVPVESVDRACARIGEPWTPIDNCQRFVVSVSGVPRVSRDASKGVALLVGAGLLASLLASR